MHTPAPSCPPSRPLRAGLVVPLVLAALGACAPPPVPEADPVSTAPSIRITWPPAETPIQGCAVVTVEVENFDLVEFPRTDINEGEGHYHVYHPGGYEACYAPWCLVDFSDIPATTEPYLVAVLATSAHDELTDDNGNPIEDRLPFEFVPGPCEFTGEDADEYDTGGDTGDTGGAR